MEVPPSPEISASSFTTYSIPSFSHVPGFDDVADESLFTSDFPAQDIVPHTSSTQPLSSFQKSKRASKLMATLGYIHGSGLGPQGRGMLEPIGTKISTTTTKGLSLDHVKTQIPSLYKELKSIKSFKKGSPLSIIDLETYLNNSECPIDDENENVELFNLEDWKFGDSQHLYKLVSFIEDDVIGDVNKVKNQKNSVENQLQSLRLAKESKEKSVEILKSTVDDLDDVISYLENLEKRSSFELDYFDNVIDFVILMQTKIPEIFQKFSLIHSIYPLLTKFLANFYSDWDVLIDGQRGFSQWVKLYKTCIENEPTGRIFQEMSMVGVEGSTEDRMVYNELFRSFIFKKFHHYSKNIGDLFGFFRFAVCLSQWGPLFPSNLIGLIESTITSSFGKFLVDLKFEVNLENFNQIFEILSIFKDTFELKASSDQLSYHVISFLTALFDRKPGFSTFIVSNFSLFSQLKSFLLPRYWTKFVNTVLIPSIVKISNCVDGSLLNHELIDYLSDWSRFVNDVKMVVGEKIIPKLVAYSKFLVEEIISDRVDVSIVFDWYSYWKTNCDYLFKDSTFQSELKPILINFITILK
ncbi:hypothetical protein P9112_009760 [Eukaryota sp. TZLM1-RC]